MHPSTAITQLIITNSNIIFRKIALNFPYEHLYIILTHIICDMALLPHPSTKNLNILIENVQFYSLFFFPFCKHDMIKIVQIFLSLICSCSYVCVFWFSFESNVCVLSSLWLIYILLKILWTNKCYYYYIWETFGLEKGLSIYIPYVVCLIHQCFFFAPFLYWFFSDTYSTA